MRLYPLVLPLAGCTLDTGIKELGRSTRGGGDSAVVEVPLDTAVSGDTADPGGEGGGTTGEVPGAARTAGTELWLAYLENLDLAFNGPPFFSVQVTAAEGAVGQLEVPATGYDQPFALAAGETAELELPDAIWYAEGSEEVGIAGVRLTADRPVEAVAFHWRLYFSEASRLLPREELSTEYRVLTVDDLGGDLTGFTVVATEDATEVEITPTAFTLGLRPADTAYTVTLDQGEVWPVQAQADLSGSLVRSLTGAPLAVFAGARQPIVGCGRGATSHVWDQLPPVDRWGRHVVVVPFARKTADTVRVMAHEDGTAVRVDCGAERVLRAGEVLELEIDAPTALVASAPVLVAQAMQGGDCGGTGSGDPDSPGSGTAIGDPSLVFVPPVPMTRDTAEVTVPLRVSSLARATRHVSAWGAEGPPTFAGSTVEVEDGAVAATLPGASDTLTGEAFSGVVHAIGEYDALTWTLGYDCVGCVTALQAAPDCD